MPPPSRAIPRSGRLLSYVPRGQAGVAGLTLAC